MHTSKTGRSSHDQAQNSDPQTRRHKAHIQTIVPDNPGFDYCKEYGSLDPFRVADRLGIEIYRKDLPRGVYGVAVSTTHRTGEPWQFILLDSRNRRNRDRWTLWHELKHCMSHQRPVAARSADVRFNDDPQEEAEAEAFAASMTMPEGALRRAVSIHGPHVRKLARIFGVYEKQMRARLQELGLQEGHTGTFETPDANGMGKAV